MGICQCRYRDDCGVRCKRRAGEGRDNSTDFCSKHRCRAKYGCLWPATADVIGNGTIKSEVQWCSMHRKMYEDRG